jgi:hypothetical protein
MTPAKRMSRRAADPYSDLLAIFFYQASLALIGGWLTVRV